jgi:hypothetical protein
MLRRSCMAGLLLVLALVFTFAGCSDNSTGNNKIVGDPNATNFQSMKAAIEAAVDSTTSIALHFAANPGKFAPVDSLHLRPDWGVMNPEDTIRHTTLNGWNIVYLGLTTGVDYDRTLVDSVRFFIESHDIDIFYTYHVVAMDYIHHGTDTYTGGSDSYQSTSSYVDLDFTNYQGTGGTINGNGGFTWNDTYRTISGLYHDTYQFTTNMTGVTFTQQGASPNNPGQMVSGAMTMAVNVTNDDQSQTWSIVATFNQDGTAQIVATTGNTEYSYPMTPSID